ncbi:MAG TPA: diheme cytochrome c-553 [candidate division Zixibacteria bacterium]|nr:diheme cytochrome c-553 [candidate division Zixibacteria bacterium]MDM7971564.1 diheme cytochrome c-553 [candidate division Zixibacteria bacterium]HOD65442.1 diheme cytochrome c-553 [candidate division Zixibacteria bacterium]HPC10649.1 diheme cytochrome c-553 [candidate division Zixibacteria bacterium]HPM36782.1 diheme cytochrome c-553 [candidate division Zixibacteria bacterium]
MNQRAILVGRGRLVAAGVVMVLAMPLAWLWAQGAPTYTAEQVKRGEYLVVIGGCHDCHTPKKMTERGPEPDFARSLSGHPAQEKLPAVPAGAITPTGWMALTNGNLTAWAGPWGVSFALNLTPDVKTGIGGWTEEMFIQALRTGKHLGMGRPILPPMPWQNLSHATTEDLRAIFAYLKSLPVIENRVPDPIPPAVH